MAILIKHTLFITALLAHSISLAGTKNTPPEQSHVPPISINNDFNKEPVTMRSGYYINSFPDISIKDITIALNFWSKEVAKQTNVFGSAKVYKNLKDMKADFYQEKLDYISASPLVFINHFDLDLLKDGYKIHPYGKSEDTLVLVTHKQAPHNHFKSLNNKRLTLLAYDPVPEMYIDTLALQHFGKKAKQIFSTIKYSNKSTLLIYDLFFKKTDAILVYETAYLLAIELNPQIKKQTQIIAQLKNIPRGLSFFHKSVPSKLREKLINWALNFNKDPRLQQLLALFKSEKIERSTLNDLKTIQQLKQKYQRLSHKHGFSQ